LNKSNPLSNQTVLVTGAAGFIGFHLIKALLKLGIRVVGIDNLNDYYDPELKQARLTEIDKFLVSLQSDNALQPDFQFIKMDLADRQEMQQLFNDHAFDIVVNLAAQAGVRYSIDNPNSYVDSNLVGFVNVLEGCRASKVKHLVYASSSSVYGMNTKQPFSTDDRVDFPISLYAATKKSNELMAHAYSHLYNIPTTGLRFFTVYGPWGRPDMAYFKFTKAILEGKPIDVYNHGQMQRDFTYIDDIIDGILRVMTKSPSVNPSFNESPVNSTLLNDQGAVVDGHEKITNAQAPYNLYNIGHNQPITLRDFITAIEKACGKKAIENSLPMQPGDVPITYADIDSLSNDTGFKPTTNIESGMENFVQWFKQFYKG
jgi:UDP-glucuronate 4-epimerase